MSNNSKNSNVAAFSSTNVISVSSSNNVGRKSSQESNRKKMFKLGKNSDKKKKLKPKKSLTVSTNFTKNNINTNNNNNKKRRKNVKKREKKVKSWPITARSSQNIRVLEDNIEDDENDNEQIDSAHSSARPSTSAALSFRAAETSEFASIAQPSVISINTTNTSATTTTTDQTTSTNITAAANMNATSNNMFTLPSSDHSNMNTSSMPELKFQLKKATVKFNKACRQLTLLDQHMSDLQNSYSNAVENDRKTFKIVFRMQLATLEGTHNAYIEYIERQVEKIKKLKQLLFTDTNINQHLTH